MIKPLHDYLLIDIEERVEAQSSAGILLGSSQEEMDKTHCATVLAVGPGRILQDGSVVPPGISAGDRVLFSKYSPVEVLLNGEALAIISSRDVYGIVCN